MKALICRALNNKEALSLEDIEVPALGSDEILINVAACGLNFPDLLILEGKYQFQPDLPYSPGGEVTGVVSRVGSGVTNFFLGQRVFAIERWGGLSEKMVIHQDRLQHLPDEIDFLSATSLLYNSSTALYALKNRGKAKPGEVILILGASGGVGLASIQLAKVLGLRVISGVRGSENIELCKQYGADEVIDISTGNFKEKVKDLTLDKGVDLVLDMLGGGLSEQAVRALAWSGRYLVVGFAAGEVPKIPLNLLLLKGADIKGVFWGKFSRDEPGKQKENLQEIFRYINSGKLKPYVGKAYELTDSKQAIIDYQERRVLGKTVVICNPDVLNKDNQQVRPREKKGRYIFLSKEHVQTSVGQELGESDWFLVTQEVINDFADSTYDHQWIHVMPELAVKSLVGSTIAHGFLTISLSPKFLTEIYEMPFAKMGINYGVDKLRFIAPVKVNSRIKMKAKLISVEPAKNDGLKLKIEALYFVEGHDKPVCSAELLSVVY